MTHLLPGGGVHGLHGARSPVPSRLPDFVTPRSVRHLGTVVAGAYPPCRPPSAWSPGLPAPPGPCYWLVASGTPMDSRRGCLAAGLVRSTVATTALAAAVPWCCVRGARGTSGGPRPVLVLASPLGLLPALASLAVRVAGCPAWVSLPFACRYAIPFGLCVPRARSACPLGPRRVSVACVCAPAPAAYAPLPPPPPPKVDVARALRAVPVQGTDGPVPGGSCPSAFPAPVPCFGY